MQHTIYNIYIYPRLVNSKLILLIFLIQSDTDIDIVWVCRLAIIVQT